MSIDRKTVYLDHAAATPTDPGVIKAMAEAARKYIGNPSAFNNAGRASREALEFSRLIVSRFLNARLEEVVFTASGSEANNLVVQGVLKGIKNPLVLTTPIEHPSVLEPLKKSGARIKYIPVSKEGIVDLKSFAKLLALKPDFISIMYANNEIGSIQPIQKISKIIKNHTLTTKHSTLLHIDACQAAPYLSMDVHTLGVDYLTFNASKLYGPKGIGVAYIRRGAPRHGLITGGGQEHGLRAGTENLPAVVGLAKAIELIKPAESEKISQLRDYMISELGKKISDLLLSGPTGEDRLPNNVHVSIPKLESEIVLVELDKYGIYAGSGSACTSHEVEPSHVLNAIAVPRSHINGALRFSLGRSTTKEDIDYTIKTLVKVIKDLKTRYKI